MPGISDTDPAFQIAVVYIYPIQCLRWHVEMESITSLLRKHFNIGDQSRNGSGLFGVISCSFHLSNRDTYIFNNMNILA